jgi:hypothetical protein
MEYESRMGDIPLVGMECESRMGEITEMSLGISLDPYCRHNSVFPELLPVNVVHFARP